MTETHLQTRSELAEAPRPAYSVTVVVPVYNEVDNLPPLHQALTDALQGLSYELIYVDDGSRDGSTAALVQLAGEDPSHTRVIELRRNFGQTAAIAAGLDHASGEVVVLIDADMQNDPADIPLLLEKVDQGFDVVSGWRIDRQDAFITRTLPSRVANWLISTVTGVQLHDYGCTLKAYRREVLKGFRLYGEMHRFIPAYADSVGAKIIEVPVRHHPRRHGKTKYGLNRILKVHPGSVHGQVPDQLRTQTDLPVRRRWISAHPAQPGRAPVSGAPAGVVGDIRPRIASASDEHHVHHPRISIDTDGLDRRAVGAHLP